MAIKRLRRRLKSVPRDLRNILAYGPEAPRVAERIWVDPTACDLLCRLGPMRRKSAVVVDWSQGRTFARTLDEWKMRCCLAHWRDGVGWEETGIYRHMLDGIARLGRLDGCCCLEDVIERYRRLDAIFEQVRREGRLRTVQEIDPDGFREWDGILVHLGPGRSFVFGGIGFHRLAMALTLGFRSIPAQVGCVHPDWLGSFHTLRARA